MAKNIDPELIGVLLVVFSNASLRRVGRGYVRWEIYVDGKQGRRYVHYKWPLDGRSFGEIQHHLEFMESLGLIKRRQEPKSTKDGREDWEKLDQWQLRNGEEFGARVPLPEEEQRDRQGRADNGNGGNGRDGGGDGNGGGGGDNDGGDGPADGNQGGGRGIAEVLSHPVLFSLPEAAFNDLIDGLFEGPGAP